MNASLKMLPDSRRIISLCCALASVALAVMALVGCGRREALKRFERPSEIRDFVKLFAQNCSGCHGADGKFGPAPPLNDPLFLAIIPDAEFTRVVAEGRTSTLMPAFARKSGGTLTDEQIAILVRGVRSKWGKADVADAASLPAYVASGDAAEGQPSQNHETALQLFGLACGNCHGAKGLGGKEAGALHDSAFLSLISDQALRRIVITGRADLGMPDFRRLGAMLPDGKPLTNQQIADVVALLASWRHPVEHLKESTNHAGGL